MTDDKKPIRLSNVRLTYPSIRCPAESTEGASFIAHIPTKWNKLTFCWMVSSLMGGMVPAISAMVGYDTQKLLPPPGPLNRPMSLWDPETLLKAIGELSTPPYEAFVNQFYPDAYPDFDAFPKVAKPIRYYIEGGHFDMQPNGTVSDQETIEFEGAPTGRCLTPFISPLKRWGESNRSPLDDIAEARAQLSRPWPHKVAVVKVESLDFGLIEARVLAAMGDKRVRGVLLDIDSAGGEIINPQLDLYRHVMMSAEKQVAKKAPPAYLKHDPTKRHTRRRKGK